MTEKRILTPETTKALKGISALCIMLGHIGNITKVPFLWIFWKSALLFVGLFLMFSGYGLMYNFINRENYLNHFFRNRILTIVIPLYLVYLLQGFVNIIFKKSERGGVKDCIKYIFLEDFLSYINWFIIEIFFLYVLFFLLFKLFHIKTASVLMGVVVIIGIFIAHTCGYGHQWIMSSISFPIGIFYAQREEKVNDFLRNRYIAKTFCAMLLCAVCYLLSIQDGIPSLIREGIFKNIACVAFIILVLEIIDKIKVNYTFTIFIGNISMEIYLVHLVYRETFIGYVDKTLIYIFGVIISTMITSILLNELDRRIIRLIRKD